MGLAACRNGVSEPVDTDWRRGGSDMLRALGAGSSPAGVDEEEKEGLLSAISLSARDSARMRWRS